MIAASMELALPPNRRPPRIQRLVDSEPPCKATGWPARGDVGDDACSAVANAMRADRGPRRCRRRLFQAWLPRRLRAGARKRSSSWRVMKGSLRPRAVTRPLRRLGRELV